MLRFTRSACMSVFFFEAELPAPSDCAPAYEMLWAVFEAEGGASGAGGGASGTIGFGIHICATPVDVGLHSASRMSHAGGG